MKFSCSPFWLVVQVFVGSFRGRGVVQGTINPHTEQTLPKRRRFGITRSSFKEEKEASKQVSPDIEASFSSDGKLDLLSQSQ